MTVETSVAHTQPTCTPIVGAANLCTATHAVAMPLDSQLRETDVHAKLTMTLASFKHSLPT